MSEIILFLFAYLLGNLLTGQIIAKSFYRKNLYKEGSGNAGARNAGRIFGKSAFVFTFLGDAAKGGIVVLISRYFDFSPSVQVAALSLVIIGHICPIFFRFHGGKGMSTFIGGFLVFQPVLFMVFILIFLCFYLLMRSLTMAGMVAVLSYPIIMTFSIYQLPAIVLCACISVIVIFAHRQNIKEYLQKKGK